MRNQQKEFGFSVKKGVYKIIRIYLCNFIATTNGATAVVLSVVFPALVLGMGIGTEAGYQYLTQRKLQHTADVSAHAAAIRKRAGDSQTEIEAAAFHLARKAGLDFVSSSIVVNNPPSSGSDLGNDQSVEVIITVQQIRLFSRLVIREDVLLRGRAVARVEDTGGKACVLSLSKTGSGAVTVSGSTQVELNGCDVAANSNASDGFLMSGSSANLSADCVYVVGQGISTGGLSSKCGGLKEFAPVTLDPYADVSEPAALGACKNRNQGSPNSVTTITPDEDHPSGVKSIRFCNGLNLKGDVKLSPGLYIIEGGSLTMNSGNIDSSGTTSLAGSGVTFYFANGGNLQLGSNAVVNVAAPTSGPFSGIAFFGSRSSFSEEHRVTGASGSSFHGSVYFPASTINFSGNSQISQGCTQIVGNKVNLTGNSGMAADCAGAGTRDIITNQRVKLVE